MKLSKLEIETIKDALKTSIHTKMEQAFGNMKEVPLQPDTTQNYVNLINTINNYKEEN